jgi:hypothetical protein
MRPPKRFSGGAEPTQRANRDGINESLHFPRAILSIAVP